uniref:Uncharacterized protein LOC105129798 isoform X4 n=1 Tax=Rhizophora mucronata TaxID=61149 RepID=A0A2P2MFQ4_RHIMU
MWLPMAFQEHPYLLMVNCNTMCRRIGPEIKKRSPFANIMVKSPFNHETDGKLRNLLKKTYLRHWMGGMDFSGNEAGSHPNVEGNFSGKRSNSLDFARMKIENATLKESIESMEHLISSVHRLRLALLKAKDSVMCEDNVTGVSEELDVIISEAKLVKTALGSSLPVSWSAEVDDTSIGDTVCNEPGDIYEVPGSEKKDFVSAVGFEMVELLILAAQMLKDDKTTSSYQRGRR